MHANHAFWSRLNVLDLPCDCFLHPLWTWLHTQCCTCSLWRAVLRASVHVAFPLASGSTVGTQSAAALGMQHQIQIWTGLNAPPCMCAQGLLHGHQLMLSAELYLLHLFIKLLPSLASLICVKYIDFSWDG